jgi:hypothetical protein
MVLAPNIREFPVHPEAVERITPRATIAEKAVCGAL